jgi:hypothetical protein
VITVKPTANVFTALAAAAMVIQVIALAFLWVRFGDVFGKSLVGG